jgi:hypothetical protein
MTRKANPRKQNKLVTIVVGIAVLVLLLRMIVFVLGHGRHRL